MSQASPFGVYDHDVYILTYRGKNELQQSETGLSELALELLVLIDGRTTVADIRKRLKAAASEVQVSQALQTLVRDGYADHATNQLTQSSDFIEFFSEKPAQPPASAVDQVRSEASSGVTTLQQHGYYVRIAMKPADRPPSEGGETVLVVEDDANLTKFLRQYLEIEGFAARIAGNREQVIAELRRQPLPDLVLLDVMLPDADGFDILLKMRAHPVLKSVPILMLTAKATRESVLKGLAGGANGYITKPFQPDSLITAVHTVLGISKDPFGRSSRVE